MTSVMLVTNHRQANWEKCHDRIDDRRQSQ